MDAKPWRDRLRDEEELLARLTRLTAEAAARRAEALRDGVADLGTVAAVARDRGRSWQAIDQALKRDERRRAQGPATTE